MRSIEAAADEMVDVHLIGLLPMPVHAAVALFHSVWIPGNLIVDQLGTVILQVDPFRRCICSKKDTHRGFNWVGLECSLDSLAVLSGHSAVHHLEAVIANITLSSQQIIKPLLGGSVFGEDDNSLIAQTPLGRI